MQKKSSSVADVCSEAGFLAAAGCALLLASNLPVWISGSLGACLILCAMGAVCWQRRERRLLATALADECEAALRARPGYPAAERCERPGYPAAERRERRASAGQYAMRRRASDI